MAVPRLPAVQRRAARVLLPLLLALSSPLAIAAPSHAQADSAAAVQPLRARIEAPGPLGAGGEPLHSADAVRAFYRAAGYPAAWSARNASALAGFVWEMIGSDGLEPDDYHAGPLRRLLDPRRTPTPAERVELDLLLTDAFLTAGH